MSDGIKKGYVKATGNGVQKCLFQHSIINCLFFDCCFNDGIEYKKRRTVCNIWDMVLTFSSLIYTELKSNVVCSFLLIHFHL